MPLTEIVRTDFDTDAKCNKFFYSPAPGGLANIADVRRVVQDGTSCIEINVGNETPTLEYFTTPNGGTDAYDKMTADIANRANGDVLYCYSKDSTKHGRYTKTGGALSARTGSVAPMMKDDENHRRVTQIRLLLQSWGAAGDPYAVPDKLGYPNFSALNVAGGRAAAHDLTGWVMRWRMRAIGLSMGRYTKIAQHYQTLVPGMPIIGTYTGAGMPYGARPFVNCLNQATCISDALGFGQGGLYAANAVEYQADSGWVDVDIPLDPRSSFWLAMGGNADKMGSEGAAFAGSLRYVVADAARWVTNWTGNAYMLECKFNPNPDADLPVIPDAESVRGRLLISSLSFLR